MYKQQKHKHLGLLLDTKLSFVEYVNDKVNKAYKLIGIYRDFYQKICPGILLTRFMR